MVRIVLDIHKSVEQNASIYYEKAKKIKRKIEGAKKAINDTNNKIEYLEKQHLKEEKTKDIKIATTKKEWYEKFRWFISSEDFMVLGGRDATTNEIIVKKHADKEDLVFHTDMVGSPFFVIKADNKEIGKNTIKEAADATVTFSRAWKLGLQNSSVFYCKPEQLSKEAPTGEYIPRGGFMTKGKLTYIENKINCAVGLWQGKIMCGPVESIKKNCEQYLEIEQGTEKASSLAKFIQKKLGGAVDDIIRVLPSGGYKIKK